MDRHTRKELEKERLRLAAKESLQLRAELLIPKNLSREELIKVAKEIDDNRAAKYVRKKPTTEEIQKKLANEIIEAYNQIDKLAEPIEEPIVEKDSDEWDVKIGDAITHFDPELSYEITGYRPITKDKGLDFDPSVFTVAADTYRRTGRYTQLIPETFAHRAHWTEEFRRCRDGITIGKYTLTGENYFFINYFRLPSVLGDNKTEALEEDFPRFFAKQYEYFHYIAIARKVGLDVNIFKSRGIGFSQISASNVACAYTFHKATHNIVTAFTADYVTNTLDKVWQELDFLNTCTEGAFRRVRMKVDTALYKRASKIDLDKNETGWMSVIEGRVHDKPRKLRGARVYNLIYEEAGSDPTLLDTYVQSRPLVDILGYRVGQRSTGGCVCAGTKVWTADNKYINIEDVTLNDKLIGFNNSVEPITYLQPESYKECVEIYTPNGNIKCSVDHPLMTVVSNHNRYHLEFKLANELKEGDHLVLSSNNNFGNVHEGHAYLLGSLLGDVNYSEGCKPTLSIGCEELYNYFNSNYKLGISKLADCSTGIYALAYFYNDVKELLKKYGMYGLSKEHKQLPNNIYDWDKQSIAEFLAGYFDTDGNVLIVKKKHRSIKLTCKYKHLLEGISSLLSKFNIYCYILPELKKSNKPLISNVTKLIYDNESHLVYVLYICNAVDILTFRDIIKLKVKYKQSRLDDYVPSGINVTFKNSLKFKFNASNGKCKCLDGRELNNVRYTKIKKIDKIGIQRIYNLTALTTHSYVSGKFLSANTGGDASSALAGLKRIFYNPKAYQVLPYKNSYAKDGSILYTGFFIPAYTLWFGKYDSRGVVDEDAAKAYYEKQWEFIENPTDLLKDKAEYCFSPEDAFILEGENRFDQEKLVEQLANIDLHKIVEKPKPASLIWPMKEGHVDRDARPTVDFNDKGKILIAELPITDDNGVAYNNLYCAGIDSIDSDASTSTGLEDVSLFCIVIYRRQFGTMAPRPVAIYKERPRDVRVAYDNALKLCLFYNCKALLEATRVSLKTYWQGFNKLNYLRHRPKSTANNTTKTNLKQYGVPAILSIIDHQLDLVNDYINDFCDLICYPELINELIRYSYANKRKFDMVAAFAMALLADEDMHGLVPKQRNQERVNEMAEFRYYKNKYGQILFGSIPKTDNYEFFRTEDLMHVRGYFSRSF